MYYDAAEQTGWPDHRTEHNGQPFTYGWDEQRRRGLASQMLIFNTEVASDEALERYKQGIEFMNSLRKLSGPPDSEDKDVTIDAEAFIEQNDAPIVGDTEEIIEELIKFREICGYEDLIVFPTIGIPGMKHEDKLEQLHTFSEEVIPYFKK